MFGSTKENLIDLLRAIDSGKLQLPEFQRSYVWNDADVRSLVASVAKGYPVGALLTLQSGGPVKFEPRLIQGVPPKAVAPDELLLDGQQRMTSLYQVVFSKAPVGTRTDKKVEVERYYYFDMKKAVSADADILDSIIGVPSDRILRGNFGKDILLDLSTPEREFSLDMFPTNRIFDPMDWLFAWKDCCKLKNRDEDDLQRNFYKKIIEPFQHYEMPIIRLDKGNSREAICLVFEKVNVGGKKLDAFELLTAIYAADKFDLREDWDGGQSGKKRGRRQKIMGLTNRRDVLAELASTDFLQGCALLYTRAQREAKAKQGLPTKEIPPVSCSKDALLALPLDAYKAYADAVQAGFVAAAEFLNEQKIVWHKDVPYPPQIVAVAATAAILGANALTLTAKEKLATWYWCGVLAEQYGSATDSRLARDVPELVDWLSGKAGPPRSVGEAIFQQSRLRSLRSRLSAAYKGIHALLMRQGCCDFISGKPTDIMIFFNEKIDIHHIFPQSWCIKAGLMPAEFNSIVNKTSLSKKSNIAIGGDAPSAYLKRIQDKQGLSEAKLDDILRTHLIEPKFLRADDFKGFFDARVKALADLVGKEMGKPVVESEVGEEGWQDVIDRDEIAENEALEDAAEREAA
jgi:hypothetical protein